MALAAVRKDLGGGIPRKMRPSAGAISGVRVQRLGPAPALLQLLLIDKACGLKRELPTRPQV